MKTKYTYYIAPLFAVLASSSLGSDDGFLENCRSEVQARLVKQDKVFTSIAARIAGSIPLECRERYRERKRLSAIESASYLAQQDEDSQYRATLTEMLETIDGGDKTLVLNYELTEQEAFKTPLDPDNPEIDLVKGYTNIRGRVNK